MGYDGICVSNRILMEISFELILYNGTILRFFCSVGV